MNKKLTDVQMLQAHFARYVDMDPDVNDLPEDKRARAWAKTVCDPLEEPEFVARCVEDYLVGKEVLALYTLSYSPRFRAAPPETPPEYACSIVVDAGYIAFDRAYQVARFKPREE